MICSKRTYPLFFSILTFSCTIIFPHPQITIMGTGYVGLVTGAGLADFGHSVTCVDINEKKISMLNNGEIPIYEIGLKEVVDKARAQNLLHFTNDASNAIENADIIFIAVDTPMQIDGQANLTALKAVVKTISEHINTFKIIVIKSTVPVGTQEYVKNTLINSYHINPELFALVSNPEFLKEGSAIQDFMHPEYIIIGTESEYAKEAMYHVYKHQIDAKIPCVITEPKTAEIIKYAMNSFLATKVSFINEIANICDAVGADVQTVAHALGLDRRISPLFLKPGPGFGGSCFPKDVNALVQIAKKHKLKIHTIKGSLKSNAQQQELPARKLLAIMQKCYSKKYGQHQQLQDKTIAILGLAFKANTDDVRKSAAIPTIEYLIKHGAKVKAYDPAAMGNMKLLFPHITYCTKLEEAVKHADAIIIMTEWDEFKNMNLEKIAPLVKQPFIIDARNILDPVILKKYSFICDGIGISCKY